MGEIHTEIRKPGEILGLIGEPPKRVISVGENETPYLEIHLDPVDQSITIDSNDDGWFWLNQDNDCQTIDDVIEALELAKQYLKEGQGLVASQDDKGQPVSADLTAVGDDELRRRAVEGDQPAFAELNRRRVVAKAWMGAA
jgi:hypothetical protein